MFPDRISNLAQVITDRQGGQQTGRQRVSEQREGRRNEKAHPGSRGVALGRLSVNARSRMSVSFSALKRKSPCGP